MNTVDGSVYANENVKTCEIVAYDRRITTRLLVEKLGVGKKTARLFFKKKYPQADSFEMCVPHVDKRIEKATSYRFSKFHPCSRSRLFVLRRIVSGNKTWWGFIWK